MIRNFDIGRFADTTIPLGDDEETILNPGDGEICETVIRETGTTRRVVRSRTIPSNLENAHAIVKIALHYQRRSRTEELWDSVDSVPLSKIVQGTQVKLELGPNQTMKLFLHLAERYKRLGHLHSALHELDMIAVDSTDFDTNQGEIQSLLESVFKSGAVNVWSELIQRGSKDQMILDGLRQFVEVNPDLGQFLAAHANLGRYEAAIAKLHQLIDSNALERTFQSLLEDNPWMFGGEYSGTLERRIWTRDNQVDFMMRRTSDDFLEVIEIKRPGEGQLFRFDNSREAYYPGPELSQAIGQVQNYLAQLDRNVDGIRSNDEENVDRIKARIIVGRDGSTPGAKKALRNLNGHFSRIEVWTFDQLLRVAEQVKQSLVEQLRVEDDIDKVPW